MTTIYYTRRAFTVRLARWVCALQYAAKPDETTVLLNFASVYADRERWAAVEGNPLETADLDSGWSFAPWRSDAGQRTYAAAFAAGLIPAPDLDDLMPRDTHLLPPTSEQVHLKFLLSFKTTQGLAESLPEDRRDEFYILANEIIRKPETWSNVEVLTGSAQWTPQQMIDELEKLATRLRSDD